MLFFELLQIALGNRESLSTVPSAEKWNEIYKQSERQSVTGILLHGIDRLPAEQRPPQAFLLQWIGVGQMIEQRNHTLDERCKDLLRILNDYGQRGSVLKGQGIALLYGNELRHLRQSGDIDVYVECGLKRTLEFAEDLGQKSVEWDYKHLHLYLWDDVEVEVHYRVEVLLNLWKNRKLQRWLKENEALLFSKNNGITTPTTEFNVFYILLHIYRHFLYEGVGMRQIVDYYMVLRTVNSEKLSVGYSLDAVAQFGLEKFAKGLMWLMQKALEMPEEWMLWKPDQKEGDYILNQVMKGGNFGHYDDRLSHGGGKVGAVKAILTHNLHLLAHYPTDVIWAPVWIVWHKLWKITRKV